VRLLLDTHVVLWWLAGDPALDDDVRIALDHDPDVYVSPVTTWEIAIKQGRGKLRGPADLAERVRDAGFRGMPILTAHTIEAGRLPDVHRDPFDRMLVAQAKCEDLFIVTSDANIPRYDVSVLHV
jgi:PIN domain nuclease of toxin-antitoxin system